MTPPHGAYVIPETDPAFAMYEGIPGSKQVQHYAAMITRTDQMVGKILDLLKELELDQNTIMFYTSDNGPNAPFAKAIDSAGGLRGTKRSISLRNIREIGNSYLFVYLRRPSGNQKINLLKKH